MSALATAAAAERRFVGLTALRWLPTGLVVPVTVLLMTSRGLSPAEIGLVFSTHGLVVVALELPTGGLADVLGRRPVLLAGALLDLAGVLLIVVADDLAGFCVAYAAVAVGRSLDTGPLEAWYVDTVCLLDPTADPTRGLSRAGVADGAALCVGAVLGGLLPLLARDQLTLPLLVAAALKLVHLAAVAVVLVPVGPAQRPRGGLLHTLREGVADVPRTVSTTLRLAARDRVLRTLLALSALTGGVLFTLELLAPLRFAELAGGGAQGASTYGVVVAGAFACAGLGSGLALRARQAAGGSSAAAMAVLGLAGAAAVVGTAVGGTVAVAGLAYCAFYLLNGAASPLTSRLLHDRVEAAQRATMVSALSLLLQLGGLATNLVVPRLADARGPAAGLLLSAGLAAAAGLLALRLRSSERVTAG